MSKSMEKRLAIQRGGKGKVTITRPEETRAEKVNRLIAEAKPHLRVEGRTLPKGYQWDGGDIEGRGSAPARRLRQLQRQQEKAARRNHGQNPKVG